MTRNAIKGLLLATSILGTAGIAQAEDVTLTVESWRNDDLAIWQEKIIPAFEAKNPGIKVVFAPTAPTEYNAALNASWTPARQATSSPAVRSTPRSNSSRRAISSA